MLQYTAAYTPCDDGSGWYVAEVIDFPGAISQGRDLAHARRMLRDALRTMAEWLIEDGQPLPRPDPNAADAEAEVVEPIQLSIRVHSGTKA